MNSWFVSKPLVNFTFSTIKQNLLLILDKNRFEGVNMLEFEQFLRQKAPKAKFRL